MCIFFKQKTAYEMRMSDWSSDVGSSDLVTPLRRTVETAEPLMRAAGADAGPMIVPELMEQHFGNWQGRPCAEVYGELGARHPFWLSPAETPPPNGESFAGLVHRVRGAVERLSAAHAGRDSVAVAHGGQIRPALADRTSAVGGKGWARPGE